MQNYINSVSHSRVGVNTRGKYGKVDPDDYYQLGEYKWRISKDYGNLSADLKMR